MILEVCCNSIDSAVTAQKAGAHRIEFCTGLALGGISPSYGLLKEYAAQISLPTRILIRPRGGDFSYTKAELNSMITDIECCASLGFEGVVSGVLHTNNSLDFHNTQQLVSAANGMKFTFHRAFDWVTNPRETLLQLSDMGVDSLLSSGGASKAIEGISLLQTLKAMNTAVTIMPGSGIRAQNAAAFKQSGFEAIHMSGIAPEQVLDHTPQPSMNSPQLLSDTHRFTTQLAHIQEVLAVLG